MRPSHPAQLVWTATPVRRGWQARGWDHDVSRTGPAWRALLDRLTTEYRLALGRDLVAIALFGSVARGEPGPGSDVDLYVVTRTPVPVLRDPRLDQVRRVREGPEAEVLVLQGFQPRPRPIYNSIEQLATHPWILLDIAHDGAQARLRLTRPARPSWT